MIFSVYSVKVVFLFSYKYDITLLSKKQNIISRKIQDDISGITEKEDIHPRKYGISY